GLRVLEDTARFVWETSSLFRKLREIRHALDRTTRSAYPTLLAARASVRDMGRTMKETPARSWRGLVVSNFRRTQEALRVLEEYGKTISPAAAPRFKAMRFRLYSAEKQTIKKFF
ncbi:MAG TPA: thiamine phosphate synthase, partial [Elusimicrobiota bacterium]|nr:thiamine phosphate synthase [Elusimicrobiota bacterium]